MDHEKIKISNIFTPESDLILHQGDCMELLQQLPDRSVKLIVTSPPYNLGKEYESKLSVEDYIAQQRNVIQECIRILHPKRHFPALPLKVILIEA